MEGRGNILDDILGEDDLEEAGDIETMDIEEGELVGLERELVGLDLQTDSRQNVGGDVYSVNQGDSIQRCKRRKKKKKPKKKKGSPGINAVNIDRFVLDVCKRLKERKTHLVYTAVGHLGVSALSDLIKEVNAIQACGGQKIADGKRFRTGGGILWNVLKTRDPIAYKEIMKKTREFEKQFRQQNRGQGLLKGTPSERVHPESTNTSSSDGGAHIKDLCSQANVAAKRASVLDRIRVPVTYDDLFVDKGQSEQQPPT